MISKIHILFLLTQLSILTGLSAADYSITVHVPGHPGEELSWFVYDEYFTESISFVSSAYLDVNGNASFNISSPENELLVLRIGAINTQFYLANSSTYQVVFDPEKAVLPIKFSNTNWSPVSFKNLSDDDLNAKLESLSKAHNLFYKKHYQDIFKLLTQPNSHVKSELRKKEELDLVFSPDDTLSIDIGKQQREIESAYLKVLDSLQITIEDEDHLSVSARYMLMELEEILGRSNEYLFRKFLNGKSYLRNIEYLNAAKNFYSGSLEEVFSKDAYARNSFIKHIYKQELDSALLVADEVIEFHGQHLEFELLLGVEKALELPNISNADVTMLLENIIRKGQEEYALMGRNLRTKFQVGKQYYEIPECNFLDLSEELHSSSEWNGKIIYLSFFATWNAESVGFLNKIRSLRSRYGNQIEFISVGMDESWNDFKDFIIDHPQYDWTFYFGNTDKLLKEKLGVVTVPHYLLIGADGKVVMDFTPDPTSIEPTFKRLLSN